MRNTNSQKLFLSARRPHLDRNILTKLKFSMQQEKEPKSIINFQLRRNRFESHFHSEHNTLPQTKSLNLQTMFRESTDQEPIKS